MTASTVEKRGFEAEVKQVLHLMINALYSNKEIFLRELISNASDAVDKLRFEGLNNSALYEGNSDLKILVDFDEEAKTITITDNGIGMSREEAIKNLGTIARSGTQEFVKALSGDQAKDSKLIGQFGVGFYSSFIVAQKVIVRTRRAGLSADQGVEWTSEGAGEYTLETINKADRGTQIVLFLKEDEVEFANNYRLRHIITKYSDHIALPIMMKEVKFDSQSAEDSDTKEKNITEPQYEVVNKATALWTVPKSDIKDEEYHELYKHISHDFQEPLTWAHNKVEGKLEYISLLYIPKKAPFDMWNPDRAKGLKLYVQRVFIMDEVEQFLPNYLRFVKGIIDSNDLPLNVSREILQSNRAIDSIRSAVSTRVLGLLETLAKEDSDKYLEFWKEFGQVLKEGPAEDYTNREKIAKLLRFASTQSNTDVQNVSLEDYISRMKEGQETIYYIAAENFNAAKNSPHLELFRQKGVEVLLLSDRIDEWLMSHLSEFGGKKLHSITRGNLDSLEFNQEEAQKSKAETEAKEQVFKDVLDRMKSVLGDKVKDVRITARLTSSPACIVADENAMTSQMERILKAAGQQIDTKPILELNPDHLLIQRLKVETDNTRFEDWSKILLDQAILSEGGQLEDPATFVKRFNEMLLQVAK